MCYSFLDVTRLYPSYPYLLLPLPSPLSVSKGSDNAAKQSTHKVVSAAKALTGLQDLIAAVVAAAAHHGIPLPDRHSLMAPSAAWGSSGEVGSGGGAVATSSKYAAASAAAEPGHAENLVQPAAWHAKNTLVRNALKEISNRQSHQQAQERAAAAAAAAAVGAAGGGSMAAALAVAGGLQSQTEKAAAAVAAATGSNLAGGATGLVRSPVKHSPAAERPAKARRTARDIENAGR